MSIPVSDGGGEHLILLRCQQHLGHVPHHLLLHGAQLIDRQSFLDEYREHRSMLNRLDELCSSAHGGSAVFSAEELMAPVSSSGGGGAPASDST